MEILIASRALTGYKGWKKFLEQRSGVKAELSTALIPVQVWDRTLRPITRSGLVPSRQDDRPQGGMRFLGYREFLDPHSYNPNGRSTAGSREGTLVDLYV